MCQSCTWQSNCYCLLNNGPLVIQIMVSSVICRLHFSGTFEWKACSCDGNHSSVWLDASGWIISNTIFWTNTVAGVNENGWQVWIKTRWQGWIKNISNSIFWTNTVAGVNKKTLSRYFLARQFQNPEGLDRQFQNLWRVTDSFRIFTVVDSFGTNLICLVQASFTETGVKRKIFTKLKKVQ